MEKEQEKLKKDLEQKIAHLKGDVDQKDRELQQEKEDKHETCQQLREQLKQALTDLEGERAEKRKLEKDLVEERIQHLQGVLERASSEVNMTWQEQTSISKVIMWTNEDLTKRQDELKAERQRKCTIYTILIFIAIIVVFVAIPVQVVNQYCSK